MLFNSYEFVLAFLPVVLAVWWLLPGTRARLLFLTLASYFFYSWWNWRFVPLMIASTTVDYIAGQKIAATDSARVRRWWLAASLSFNLLILGFFKYYNFFASSVAPVGQNLGMHWSLPVLNIVLPVGISFYTFNSMSYTIDLYRGRVRPARSLLHFSTFVAMFPHLIAGPIVRFSDIEERLANLRLRLGWADAGVGLSFFVLGLGKKILIADRLAPFVDDYFSAPSGHGAVMAWVAVIGYALQIYFDFSGYSDMAVGLARLLGFQFPINFNSPYKAMDIADFWRRWHISLSTWLRDYLFIPLGGSRGSTLLTARNLFLTMFLGGLWHGANWTFVAWGLYHGALLAGLFFWKKAGSFALPVLWARATTFLAVLFGWVLFRSDGFPTVILIWRQMFGFEGIGHVHILNRQWFMLCFALILTQSAPNTWEIRWRPRIWQAVAMAAITLLVVLYLGKTSPFLYFQF